MRQELTAALIRRNGGEALLPVVREAIAARKRTGFLMQIGRLEIRDPVTALKRIEAYVGRSSPRGLRGIPDGPAGVVGELDGVPITAALRQEQSGRMLVLSVAGIRQTEYTAPVPELHNHGNALFEHLEKMIAALPRLAERLETARDAARADIDTCRQALRERFPHEAELEALEFEALEARASTLDIPSQRAPEAQPPATVTENSDSPSAKPAAQDAAPRTSRYDQARRDADWLERLAEKKTTADANLDRLLNIKHTVERRRAGWNSEIRLAETVQTRANRLIKALRDALAIRQPAQDRAFEMTVGETTTVNRARAAHLICQHVARFEPPSPADPGEVSIGEIGRLGGLPIEAVLRSEAGVESRLVLSVAGIRETETETRLSDLPAGSASMLERLEGSVAALPTALNDARTEAKAAATLIANRRRSIERPIPGESAIPAAQDRAQTADREWRRAQAALAGDTARPEANPPIAEPDVVDLAEANFVPASSANPTGPHATARRTPPNSDRCVRVESGL